MDIEKFAEIKEKMMIAKEQGNMEAFKKYYKLVVEGYEQLTGQKFEDKMEELKKKSEGREIGD